jgi:hypothetical protein
MLTVKASVTNNDAQNMGQVAPPPPNLSGSRRARENE